jgi:SNF2 family DNA or RNA helicase
MFNRYLEKIGERLQKHQEEALAQLESEGGVLAHHSTGSGKSLLMISAIQRAQKKNPEGRTLLITPASLTSNIEKERQKHNIKIDMSKVDLRSYEKATNEADSLSKNKYMLAICDEAHKLRNTDTKRTKSISDLLSKADHRLLATATGQYNHMADISPLVNIVAGHKVLPEDRKEMLARYTRTTKNKNTLVGAILRRDPGETIKVHNKEELKHILQKYVHHYDVKDDPSKADKFPTKEEKIIEVPMSTEQTRMYKFVEGKIPWLTKMKIRNNLPLDKKEKANLNAFSSGIRQSSNSVRQLDARGRGDYTPKMLKAVASVKKGLGEDPNFRGLVYSNFLEAGVNEYSRKLEEEGIDHHVYTGGLTGAEKDAMVKDYNTGKKKVLVISSSGAEGLDLKGTKKIQILEPHFNPSKIRQVVGRGVRYESHAHLPPSERHVEVEHYLSVNKKPLIGKAHFTIDKYLTENSDDKQELFDDVQDLMK